MVKRKLSGSTDSKPIKIAATWTPGTAIHTSTSSTGDGDLDEIWLWAWNEDSVDRLLTLEVGSANAPMSVNIPARAGAVAIMVGDCPMQASATMKAFAAVANVIYIRGYVNRITEV